MRKWIPPVLVLASATLSALVYEQLPARVVFDPRALIPLPWMGDAAPLARPLAAFLLPAVAAVAWLVLHEAPVGPLGRLGRRFFPGAAGTTSGEYAKFAGAYRTMVIWVVALVLALHTAILAGVLGWPVAPGLIVGGVLAAGLVGAGNLIPRLRPNPIAGIRTSRTMRDPRLWARVHRRFGVMCVAGGVLVALVALFLPRFALLAGAAVLLGSSVATLVVTRRLATVLMLAVVQVGVFSPSRAEARPLRVEGAATSGSAQRGATGVLPADTSGDTLPPRTVRESDLTVQSGGVTLHGTLTLPAAPSAAKVPVVLIVAGSGPTDRQGNALGTPVRPYSYARLAWGLAEHGIATVRYDKRGIGRSVASLDLATLTLDAFRDDVIAAARQLRGDPRFGPLVLLGHSEGAGLVLQAANAGAPADAIVMVSAAGRPLVEILRDQFHVQFDSATSARAQESLTAYLAGAPVRGDVPDAVKALLQPHYRPLMLSMAAYSPAAEIARVTLPVLVVHGRMDLQATDRDFDALVAVRPDAARLVLPNANHVLKTVSERTMSAQMRSYTDPRLELAPELVPGIVSWVARVGTVRSPPR